MKKENKIAVLTLASLIVAIITTSFASYTFFDWAFNRHLNPISWYIQPVFLLTFCFFAYRKSIVGILATVLMSLTSAFWFPQPERVSELATTLTYFQAEWFYGVWGAKKIMFTLLFAGVISGILLSFWNRSLIAGILTMFTACLTKLLWDGLFAEQVFTLTGIVMLVISLLTAVSYLSFIFAKGYDNDQKTVY